MEKEPTCQSFPISYFNMQLSLRLFNTHLSLKLFLQGNVFAAGLQPRVLRFINIIDTLVLGHMKQWQKKLYIVDICGMGNHKDYYLLS